MIGNVTALEGLKVRSLRATIHTRVAQAVLPDLVGASIPLGQSLWYFRMPKKQKYLAHEKTPYPRTLN